MRNLQELQECHVFIRIRLNWIDAKEKSARVAVQKPVSFENAAKKAPQLQCTSAAAGANRTSVAAAERSSKPIWDLSKSLHTGHTLLTCVRCIKRIIVIVKPVCSVFRLSVSNAYIHTDTDTMRMRMSASTFPISLDFHLPRHARHLHSSSYEKVAFNRFHLRL